MYCPGPCFCHNNDKIILIEEGFTVWRDSERYSWVLLGIYLGESLGESFSNLG